MLPSLTELKELENFKAPSMIEELIKEVKISLKLKSFKFDSENEKIIKDQINVVKPLIC